MATVVHGRTAGTRAGLRRFARDNGLSLVVFVLFLALVSMVVLSIYLRQRGSPESKPVDAPHSETGGG